MTPTPKTLAARRLKETEPIRTSDTRAYLWLADDAVTVWACAVETELEHVVLSGVADSSRATSDVCGEVAAAIVARLPAAAGSALLMVRGLEGQDLESFSQAMSRRDSRIRTVGGCRVEERLWRSVRLEALRILDEVAGPVVYATDGSARRGASVASSAWVSSDGRSDTAATRGDVLDAELTAIAMAAAAAARHGRAARILSDSRSALSIATKAVADPSSGCSRRGHSALARRIRSASKQVPITFGYVRAHDGHRLNELADRLAVMTRRCVDAGVGTAERAARANEIVRTVLAGPSQENPLQEDRWTCPLG